MPRLLTPIADLATYPGRYVRPAALALYLGLPRRTIYHHIEKGALTVVKRGGVILIKKAVAQAYADC